MRKHEFVANLPLSLLAKKNSKLEMRHFVSRSRCPERRLFLIISRRGFGQANTCCLSVLHVANCYRISLVVRYCQTRAPAELPIDKSRRDLSQFCPRGTLSVGGFFFDHGISSLIADIAFTGRLETAKTVVNCINDGQCTVRQ